MSYTVAYIKDGKEYVYDNFIDGATISDIAEELTYNTNRYGVDYEEIGIFNRDGEEAETIYYIHGYYKLVEWV